MENTKKDGVQCFQRCTKIIVIGKIGHGSTSPGNTGLLPDSSALVRVVAVCSISPMISNLHAALYFSGGNPCFKYEYGVFLPIESPTIFQWLYHVSSLEELQEISLVSESFHYLSYEPLFASRFSKDHGLDFRSSPAPISYIRFRQIRLLREDRRRESAPLWRGKILSSPHWRCSCVEVSDSLQTRIWHIFHCLALPGSLVCI